MNEEISVKRCTLRAHWHMPRHWVEDTKACEEPVYYHGTRTAFGRGGYVMPRAFHGRTGTSAPVNPGRTSPEDADDYVYVTTSKTLAWVYAWHAPGLAKPRVLTVLPSGLEPDPEHSEEMQAYRCQMAKVVGVDHEPEITEAEAREGWVSA